MAYIYKHIRLDTNEVFYIGIGSDNTNKIPTVEEFYKQTTGCIMNHGDIKKAMIEFAKLHVEAALEEANRKVIVTYYYDEGIRVNKDSILNAYPLENIK